MRQQIISLVNIKLLLSQVADTNVYDSALEMMLDNIVDRINNQLGVDVSKGPLAPITQRETQTRNYLEVIRLVLSADGTQPFFAVEGPDRTICNGLILTGRMVRKGYYTVGTYGWTFDTNLPSGSFFFSPVELTYWPNRYVFGVISDAMLKLLRLKLNAFNIGQSGLTSQSRIAQISDREHSITFTGEKEYDLHKLEQDILAQLKLDLQGHKIG